MFRKAGITAVLSTLVMLASSVPAQARDSCDKRVRKAEDNLRKEIRKHGDRSTQAMYRRRQLEEAREQCGREHNRDRDHDRDGHDRDRDRDRDHR
jgi:hypothetical protein